MSDIVILASTREGTLDEWIGAEIKKENMVKKNGKRSKSE